MSSNRLASLWWNN